MAKKIKKNTVSVGFWDKVMKDSYDPTTEIVWHGEPIIIKNTISFSEMLQFVDGVVETCFSADEGEYIPEAKDLAIRSYILTLYADFNMPTNIEHRYELLYCTDAMDVVFNCINKAQFNEIIRAIDAKIENILRANVSEIHLRVHESLDKLDELYNQFGNMFKGLSPEDMVNLIESISNNKLDETKLMDAYLKRKENAEIPVESVLKVLESNHE